MFSILFFDIFFLFSAFVSLSSDALPGNSNDGWIEKGQKVIEPFSIRF